MTPGRPGRQPGLTRRRLLGSAGVAGVGIGLGGTGYALGSETADAQAPGADSEPFYGAHQSGIVTPAQDRLHFAAFDLTTERASDLRELLRSWSEAAARMARGLPAGPENSEPLAPQDDTGEALGLPPSRLTVTFGLGPGVFERDGEDRFGLARRRPARLRELGRLPNEALEAARSGGDLCVQACADDPQVAFHAVRNLTRIGRGLVVMRWSQLGFGRTSSTSSSQTTPRNLMGFKDGTNNIHGEDTEAMRDFVWLGPSDDPRWMRGGTYMVARRIRMLLEVWDRSALDDQETTIGRHKASGAPLGGSSEFEPVDLEARKDGDKAIPIDAHIRLAGAASNRGERILRRGYSFTDGVDERLGQLDAGLFFVCFQRDPERQFSAIQRRLGGDALNEYIVHTGSGVFAIPPGARRGGYVGESLFA